jgi:hypothetical protein
LAGRLRRLCLPWDLDLSRISPTPNSADNLYIKFLDVSATMHPGCPLLVGFTRPSLYIVLAMTEQ